MLPEPVGEVISSSIRPNGLELQRFRVPLGVVFFIYESRPNVTTGRRGHLRQERQRRDSSRREEAAHSNRAIVEILDRGRREIGLAAPRVQLVAAAAARRRPFAALAGMYIDLAIPRGGESLIRRVPEARMPVIKHFAGNCHVYVDRAADLHMAERIMVNAKCQRMGSATRPSRCWSHDVAAGFLPPRSSRRPRRRGVEIRGDPRTRQLVPQAERRPTRTMRRISWTEISVRWSIRSTKRSVTSTTTARGIPTRSSPPTRRPPAICARVDSAAVMVNASTRNPPSPPRSSPVCRGTSPQSDTESRIQETSAAIDARSSCTARNRASDNNPRQETN